MKDDKKGQTVPMHWPILLGLAMVLVAAMLLFYYGYPALGLGSAQPIPFSHRVHAGVKQINCRFCHSFVNRSQHAGLPAVEKCFFCHKYIIPSHPEILKEKAFLATNTPVPWVRIYFVPDYVKFQHKPHIEWAKIECTECHGQVATMDRLQRVNFQMGFCIGCHQKRQGPLDCWLACHH